MDSSIKIENISNSESINCGATHRNGSLQVEAPESEQLRIKLEVPDDTNTEAQAIYRKKSRIGRISTTQRAVLFDFVRRHKQLINTKFSPEFRPKHAQTLWQALTEKLNFIPGAKKNWKQWRKTWQDFHSKTKMKSCRIAKRKRLAEGGKALKETLTPVEEDILDIISLVKSEHRVDSARTETQFSEPLGETEIYGKKSRIGRISVVQRTALLEFIKRHRELVNTKFTPTFRPRHARALWQALTEGLNSIPGTKKNWKQWRKTWHDYHSKTKIKSSYIDRHKQTGDSKALSDGLTSVEEDILNIISVAEEEVVPKSDLEINGCVNTLQEPCGKPPANGHLSDVQNSNLFIVNDAGSYRLPVNHMPLTLPSDEISLEPQQRKPSKLKATVAQPTQDRILESSQRKPPKFKIGQKRNLSAQHLHHIIAANKLTAAIHKENVLKENYYKEKLKILQEQATAMSRIATALEILTDR